MVVKRRVLLTSLVALLNLVSWAQPPVYVIRRVSVQLPDITIYLTIQNQAGTSLPAEDFAVSAATMQGSPLKLADMRVARGTAYTLLIDVSGSVRHRREDLDAIGGWIDGLPPEDHLEIFAFGSTSRQVGSPTSDRATLKAEVEKLQSADQTTNLYSTLEEKIAYAARADRSLPEGRMVVLLTDGKDEGSDGADEATLHDRLRQSQVPIESIGYTRLGASVQDTYLAKLKSFADESGGFYECAGTAPSAFCPVAKSSQSWPAISVKNAFDDLSNRAGRTAVLHMTCGNCQASGNQDLRINFSNGAVVTTAVPVSLSVAPPIHTQRPAWEYIAGAGLLLLILAVVVGWLVWRRKSAPGTAQEVTREPTVVLPESGLPAHFTIVNGQEPGRIYRFKLASKVVVGRDPECGVVLLGDQEISGRHCELIKNGTRIEIVDLGSLNGTLLNGAYVVARQRVENGDLIRVARTEFRISFGEG